MQHLAHLTEVQTHTYYKLNDNLYYVIDILEDDVLVEDCKTLHTEWFSLEAFGNLDFERVTRSKNKGGA